MTDVVKKADTAIAEALKERILVLDGAMGTQLQQRSLAEEDFRGGIFKDWPCELKGNNECLCLTRGDVLLDIHRSYIAAGADIITTNSFSANRISQSEYGCADYAAKMAYEAARLARKAADEAGRKVWVAGDVGPTGKSLSLASDLSDPAYRRYDFDAMAEAYKEQIAALVDGGADIILFETCFDALNVKAGLYAIDSLGLDIPVMVSVSVSDRSGRTLTGQTIEAFYHSVAHGRLLSFGLNCSLGARELEPLLADLSVFACCNASCHPNAGLPDEMGRYTETAASMAQAVRRMGENGLLNIVGGCCGTTPDHIRAIAGAVADLSPRALPEQPRSLTVSGLEAVCLDTSKCNFTNIGERTNVAGSRKFAKLIASGDYDQALLVAANQIEGGASVIDVNMDDAMLDSSVEMVRFLRHISNDPAVASAALMIDSSHWDTIVGGLKNAQGKCIVNSISLKEGEEVFLEHARLIRSLGAAVVVMAFDEEGQATTYRRKIEICARAYDLLTQKVGFAPWDIIFDVNVLSVGTGLAEHRRYGVDFIEAVRWIKGNLPCALTSGGISNLSFAFRGNNPVREAMHSVFLFHARAAGLDMGIVNPGMLQIYDNIEPDMLERVEDVILDRREDATDRLIAKAQELAAGVRDGGVTTGAPCGGGYSAGQSIVADEASTADSGDRIIDALVKGKSDTLQEDLMEQLGELGTAVAVIEGPLMDGMKKVGEYFGEGKMFLPQVIKSAKIMRDAVDILKPYMGADGEGASASRPKVVIATVKGDVHDIGKNITSIVLGCNGFEVADLGVMVPKETILAKAEEIGADFIAVSGLITPSLFQMEELCREMTARGMTTPLFVGGATASALHTAVKLAPLYDHVYYGSDASDSAVKFKTYLMDAGSFEKQQHEAQQKLRDIYCKSGSSGATADASTSDSAGVNGTIFPAESYLRGQVFTDIPAGELDVSEIIPYIDWQMLKAIWRVKEDDTLLDDAKRLLEHLVEEKLLHVNVGLHFEMAHSESDGDGQDWIVLASGRRLPMFRQSGGDRRSLSDFLPPASFGFESQLGFFAASVTSDEHADCDCQECRMDYEPMLLRTLKMTLAEAASLWVDARLRCEFSSYGASGGTLPVGVRVVKPAAGYYSCPDHTMKQDILELIPSSTALGIVFTESYAMIPDASICAFVFAHPKAGYPEIRKAAPLFIERYASARGFSAEQAHTFLGHLSE